MKNALTPFGCQFLAHPEIPFFPEDFSADDRLMIKTAEDFSRKEVLPVVERLDAQEDGLMVALIKKAGELGLCGVDAPEEFGGLGLGKNLAARILELMSLNGSFSVTFGITSGISQVGLSLFGNSAQKERYLPRVTSGEWIGAYCLSEPNSGSDALSLTTRATKDGSDYLLNGTKMWISNAKWADLFLVMAKTDGDKLSAFLVERNSPGISIAREEHKLGLKGSSTARVVLENVRVSASNLLHEEGLGHHVAFNALNLGRFKLASMSIGPARHAIELAFQYAQERRQFGQPIANFDLIKRKLCLMMGWFFVAESMIYRTGAQIDRAFEAFGGTIDGNRKAAEEFAIESSVVKVLATEAEAFIVDEALQIYGGYGYTEEFPIARHYRDARVSRIYEGTNEINRIFIADRIGRRMRESKISGDVAVDSFVTSLLAEAIRVTPANQVESGALADLIILAYADQSSRMRATLGISTGAPLFAVMEPVLNSRAAEAYQLLTGKAVSVPAVEKPDLSHILSCAFTG